MVCGIHWFAGGAVVAKGADIVAGGCPAHTIYIWPSRELIARSWDWPEAWHEAFEQAAGQLAGLVATCVLGGLPVTQEPAARQLRAGRASFRVKCSGTRIYIAVLDFEGPHPPGPDGGTRKQPYPVDNLVLGLRGSGKSFTIVTFYGPLPPVPAENIVRRPWRSAVLVNIQGNGAYGLHSRPHPTANIMWMPVRFGSMLPQGTRQGRSTQHDLASILNLVNREKTNDRRIFRTIKKPRSIWLSRCNRSMRRKQASVGGGDLESTRLLSLPLRPVDCWLDRGEPWSDSAPSTRLH
jgi:hypothetical protein